MAFEGLESVTDMSVADWIAPRLRGFGGRVTQVVPDGFAAYARILHPADDEFGEPTTWAEVCRRTGRTAHPLMQWSSVAAGGRWTPETAAGPPRVGEAPPAVLGAILDVLGGFSDGEPDCFHAMWEGWGWLHPGGWALLVATDDPSRSAPPHEELQPNALSADVLAGPRLDLPARSYLLFRGPLHAALRMGHQVTSDWFVPQPPSLLWPADRSWCLATEIDFDSTLVGGPRELVDALTREPSLEAWPVQATDDLTVHGDRINPGAGA